MPKSSVTLTEDGDQLLVKSSRQPVDIRINRYDALAIADHFGLLDRRRHQREVIIKRGKKGED